MPYEELLALLNRARTVLDRYMFDLDETMRDDVAQVCMAIDDALPDTRQLSAGRGESIPRIYAVRGITR